MKARLMAVSLPFMCLATAILFLLAIPLAVMVTVILLIKPGIADDLQAKAQKKMIHVMFSRITKGAMTHV